VSSLRQDVGAQIVERREEKRAEHLGRSPGEGRLRRRTSLRAGKKEPEWKGIDPRYHSKSGERPVRALARIDESRPLREDLVKIWGKKGGHRQQGSKEEGREGRALDQRQTIVCTRGGTDTGRLLHRGKTVWNLG